MKQLLLILSIGLLTVGCQSEQEQERYAKDEVTEDENGIIVLVSDGTPVNGVVFKEPENGQLSAERNYKDGKPDGLHREWFENGQLSWEANFKDGKPDGLTRMWHDNGQLYQEVNYKDGEYISTSESWDEDGNLIKDETD